MANPALTQQQLAALYQSGIFSDPSKWGAFTAGSNGLSFGGNGAQLGQGFQADGYNFIAPDAGGGTWNITPMQGGNQPGATYYDYQPGQDPYAHQVIDGGQFKLSDYKDLGQAAALLGSMYLGGQGLAALGAGSAGGIGGTGFAAGGAGTAGGTSALAGDVLSKAALDGTTAFGANSAPGAFDLASTAGAGGGGGLLSGTGGATGAGSTVANYGSGLDAGMTAPAATDGAYAQAVKDAATPSWLSSVANTLGVSPTALTSALGLGTSLLGAVAGSQPVTKTATQQQDIPDWLKPYVTGPNGLLASAQQTFQQNQGNQAGWQAIQNKGLGLLSQPVAGNGYAQFAAMPRFGG
jgi:hypothetical protein